MRTHVDRGRQIDALMRIYQGDAPGACVAVLQAGHAVAERAYGLSDVEAGTRALPVTNYRIASISKQFTSAAILLLAQEGSLTIEDPIRAWLPSLPLATREMTIRHLLTHTSGVVDYEDIIPPGTPMQLRYLDVLRLLEAEDRRYGVPGTTYRYSNSGYVLLAAIVEKVSGERFAAFLMRRIFVPLGMEHTIAHEEGVSVVPHRAYGYVDAAGSWIRRDQSLTSATLGDGGIYTSILDLAKWDAALYDERLLRRDLLDLAFAPAVPTPDPAVHYGFGWRITGESVWHSGETIGFRSVIIRYPTHRFTVMILSNRDAPEPYASALAIAKLYLPNADAARARDGAVGPDSAARPFL